MASPAIPKKRPDYGCQEREEPTSSSLQGSRSRQRVGKAAAPAMRLISDIASRKGNVKRCLFGQQVVIAQPSLSMTESECYTQCLKNILLSGVMFSSKSENISKVFNYLFSIQGRFEVNASVSKDVETYMKLFLEEFFAIYTQSKDSFFDRFCEEQLKSSPLMRSTRLFKGPDNKVFLCNIESIFEDNMSLDDFMLIVFGFYFYLAFKEPQKMDGNEIFLTSANRGALFDEMKGLTGFRDFINQPFNVVFIRIFEGYKKNFIEDPKLLTSIIDNWVNVEVDWFQIHSFLVNRPLV